MADVASLIELHASGTAPRGASRANDASDDAPPAGRDQPADQPAEQPLGGEVAAASETVKPAPDAALSAPTPSAAVRQVPRARRGGRVFSAACAVLSLIGAGVALTAPTLRPQAFDLARQYLGDDSVVLRYLAPPAAGPEQPTPAAAGLTYPTPAFQAPGSPRGDTSLQAAALAAVRAELIATLRLEVDGVRHTAAEQAARLSALGAAFQSEKAEVTAARSDARAAAAAAHTQEVSLQALSGVTERLDRAEAQVAAFDARLRATGLVVTAGQLRRDIDAGAPLHDDLAALASSGPLPPRVQQALDQLSRSEAGVPTFRDLAVGFEAVDAAIVAHGGGQASWVSLSGWLGGSNPQRETLDRLRALAAEGRFTEVADSLERTEWADLAQRWGAQARQRSAAVIAGQAILANALAAYEASQATPPAWPQAGPSAAPGRASP